MIVACALAALFAWQNARAAYKTHQRFVVDDAYITLRYARHLADGAGAVWNAGERVEGYTSFLAVVLIASLHRLGLDLLDGALMVNLAGFVLLVGAVFYYGFRISRGVARAPVVLLPTLIVASSPAVVRVDPRTARRTALRRIRRGRSPRYDDAARGTGAARPPGSSRADARRLDARKARRRLFRPGRGAVRVRGLRAPRMDGRARLCAIRAASTRRCRRHLPPSGSSTTASGCPTPSTRRPPACRPRTSWTQASSTPRSSRRRRRTSPS